MELHELCHIFTCRCPCKVFLARKMVSIGVMGKKNMMLTCHIYYLNHFLANVFIFCVWSPSWEFPRKLTKSLLAENTTMSLEVHQDNSEFSVNRSSSGARSYTQRHIVLENWYSDANCFLTFSYWSFLVHEDWSLTSPAQCNSVYATQQTPCHFSLITEFACIPAEQ